MPRIAVIATGGTIATPGRDALDMFEYGQFAQPAGLDGLLRRYAAVLQGFELVPVAFRALDSAAMEASIWLELNRAVSGALADGRIDGVVITHGTSTLEESAYFLHLTAKAAVPIVVVGAQRPPTGLGSDAGSNLLNALRVAAAPQARGLGVLVAMNEEIHSAREVTKGANFRLHAFHTPGHGALGNIEPDGTVCLYRRPLRRHAPDTEFEVSQRTELPAVEVVYSYAGASPAAVDAFVRAGARGIVVAGMPPGRASPAQRQALVLAAQAGVLVVQCSRAGSGRIVQRSEDRDAGFVPADNLNPQKARILAMLGLAHATDARELRRMFGEY